MASVISRIISETAPGNARSCANLDISFEHKTFHDKDGYEWDVGHRSLARIIIGGLQPSFFTTSHCVTPSPL
jgi:hypothetical protein